MTRNELEMLLATGGPDAVLAEIASLRAQLAEARKAALEEAAKVVDEEAHSPLDFEGIAARIRALATPGEDGTK
jgi:hypothetical protein